VAFDPTGDLLAVAGDDGVATLWTAAARLVGELRHSSAVADVAWSNDGRFLLTAAGDGAHLWDVESLQRIQQFTVYGGAHAVAFTPDDGIVTGATDGTVRFHRCTVCGPVEDLLEMARQRSIRELSSIEHRRFLQEPDTDRSGVTR
jgi:WD40 repeat protein